MSRVALVVPFLVLALFAQGDPLASVAEGDRVELEMRNGNLFRGEVMWILERRVKLDVSFENPDTDGAVVFDAADIRRATRLEKLSAEDKNRIRKEKEDRRRKLLAEIAAREAEGQEGVTPEEGPESRQEASDRELLEKFPASEWTDERYQELMRESATELTEDEAEFLRVYETWRKAVARQERDNMLGRFSPGNGWDEARYGALLTRDEATWTDEEREFVQLHDTLVKARDEKQVEDRSALLDEFPPGTDWNERAYEQLRTKFIRIKVAPTEREQRFIDGFEDWKLALKEREEKLREEEETKKKLRDEMEKEEEPK